MVFLPNYFDIFKALINVETALFLLDLILLVYFFLVFVSDILGEQAEAVESNNKNLILPSTGSLNFHLVRS